MEPPTQTLLDQSETNAEKKATTTLRAGKAWYGWIVAALAILAGIFASISPTTLHEPWPFFGAQSSWAATLFYICLFSWSVLYFNRERAKGEEFERMQRIAEYLKEAVQTLPNPAFIRLFNRMTTDSRCYPLPAGNVADLEKAIRMLLGMVARLAAIYDDRREVRYAANVMLYVHRRPNPPYFPHLDETKVRQFLPKDFGLEFLEGVLVLFDQLSSVATEGAASGVQDSDLKLVCFGIRSNYLNDAGDRWTVLPGAPVAFLRWNSEISQHKGKLGDLSLELRKAVQGSNNIRALVQAIEHSADVQFELDEHVRNAIKGFYNAEGQKVLSFQAFPLVLADGMFNAFGVLNIHCDQEVFLGEYSDGMAKNRQNTFSGVISPLVFDIAAAVGKWWELVRQNHE